MSSLCPNKEICGSCSWSHIPYDKQLKQKLSDINGSFRLKKLNLVCDHILSSPLTEHYRNRMDFVIDFEGRVGMRQKEKWWKVIDGHTCFLADKKIDRFFAVVRDWVKTSGISFYDRKIHIGLLRYAVIRVTRLGESMINIITSVPQNQDETDTLWDALNLLATTTGVTTLIWSQNNTLSDVSFGTILQTVTGQGVIHENIGDFTYIISPNAFFQTNSHGAAQLLDTVDAFCGDLTNKTLLDLFCGSGFFSIALSDRTGRTVGVEMIEEATLDAKYNAQFNHVACEYMTAKTEEFDWGSIGADLVILDPPRSGMHDKALADILKIAPAQIVYVSCNPKNFAREMVQLQQVYTVENMQAIDMFPHTPHVELVTKLRKKYTV